MKELAYFQLMIDGHLVGLKICKYNKESEQDKDLYEFKLSKHFKQKGNADYKRAGGTFMSETLEGLLFRINNYKNDLERTGIESETPNGQF